MSSQYFGNSIFWIEVEKIKPNPFQPRREFDDARLGDLADSIRMYGVLQPLVVTRKEKLLEDGGLSVEYELISGERRLRASKLAGISQVPVIIRSNADDDRVKLELAIIENLQREDLNPIDRARAFQKLVDEFKFKHSEIAGKIGKSREYVSNSVRLLTLPEEMIEAVAGGRLSEGHARPLMMLVNRPEEQKTLFKEITFKKLSVRESESIARKIAVERARKRSHNNPEITELESKLTESLGTRVQIEERENGGRIHIDFFTPDDVRTILKMIQAEGGGATRSGGTFERTDNPNVSVPPVPPASPLDLDPASPAPVFANPETTAVPADQLAPVDDRSAEEKKQAEDSEEDLYSVRNFSI